MTDEIVASTGDRFQTTTRGLMILNGGGSWTAFTDGQSTWIINGPNGLQIAGTSQPAETSTGTTPGGPNKAVPVMTEHPGHPSAPPTKPAA